MESSFQTGCWIHVSASHCSITLNNGEDGSLVDTWITMVLYLPSVNICNTWYVLQQTCTDLYIVITNYWFFCIVTWLLCECALKFYLNNIILPTDVKKKSTVSSPCFGFVFTLLHKSGKAVNTWCEYKLKNKTGKALDKDTIYANWLSTELCRVVASQHQQHRPLLCTRIAICSYSWTVIWGVVVHMDILHS